MPISSLEYRVALENITQAMTQLQPDGRCCVLCGDNDHQAWECRINVLVAAKNGSAWEKVVSKSEEIFGCIDHAESPLMANLPNLARGVVADFNALRNAIVNGDFATIAVFKRRFDDENKQGAAEA